MYCGHMLVVAVLVAMLWQIQPTDGRRKVTNSAWYKALQKVANQPPSATKEKCKTIGKSNDERAKSCLELANCHLTHGDILRQRNESYESYYDEARKEIEHFNNRFKCGQRKIYRECQEKLKSCWRMARMMAINGQDELLFVNDCDGQTMQYSHNLCIGKKIGHWPNDIYNVMEKFHPTWCNMGCSSFREYNDFHKKMNVTEFPQDWNVGLELGIEDQDTRAMGRDIVSLAIMLSGMRTRSGLEVRNMMGDDRVKHNISIYGGGSYCYRSSRCENVKCPRTGVDCFGKEGKDSVTGERVFPCYVCRFDQEELIEVCNYCMKPKLCLLYAQCTGCSTKDDTCDNCAIGSTCERGKKEGKTFVEEDCRTCTGCIDTTCQTCLGCFFHREIMPHSPEAICLFYNNCTRKGVPQGPETPKQRGLMEDIENCKNNTQCLKRLIPIPWIVPMGVSFSGGYIDPKFITFNTKSSVRRVESWVVQIYDDLPNSIVGICFNATPEVDSLDNRIGIPKMDDLNIGKFVNCGRGDAGIFSYLRGATIQLTNDTENGTEYIHSAKWHCSATEENIGLSRKDKDFEIPGKEGKKQTRMCPQEMVVCSLRTFIANIGGKASEKKEKYVIVNMEFGCCDVTPAMFYSGINYVVQRRDQNVLDNNDVDYNTNSKIRSLPDNQVQSVPDFKPEPPGCMKSFERKVTAFDLRKVPDYRSCKPITRLCPGGHFISRLEIVQFADESFPFKTTKGNLGFNRIVAHLLQLNFICTDYNNDKKQSGTSLSEGLYKNDKYLGRRKSPEKETKSLTIDCGPKKYAFGINAQVQLATIPLYGAFSNTRMINLHCGDNENPDSYSTPYNQFEFDSHKRAKDDYSRNNSDFKCSVGHALCGFQLRPVELHYSSGYDYRFICCPIPVRQIVLQSCKNGVTYDVERDAEWEDFCKPASCVEGTADGVITELVALPEKKPTFHNPDWHEKLRYAIVSTTNVNYGGGFRKFFDRNNQTGYLKLKPVALELRDKTTEFLTSATTLVSALSSLGVPGFGAVCGVIGLVSWVNSLVNPKPDVVGEALAKISQQLNAIQDAIQQGRVYTEIQRLNVNLTLKFKFVLDPDRTDPRYYNVTATCGIAKYDMYGHDIFYYVPNKICQFDLKEEWRPLVGILPLDNRNRAENRTFVVRFNSVGTVIRGEDKNPNSLSHWLKWDDLIRNLDESDGFGKDGPTVKSSIWTDLLKRPNSIKFYYVDVPVPSGHMAQVYQLVGMCNKWELYTKIINFKVSTKTDPLWDLIPDLADVRPVVRE